MQKNVALAIALSLAVLFLVPLLVRPTAPVPAPRPAPGTPSVATGTRAPALPPSQDGAPPAPRADGRAPAAKYADGPDEKISNGRLELTFASRGGALRSAEAFGCLYHTAGDRAVAGDPGAGTDWVDGMPGALAVDVVGLDGAPDLTRSNWKLTKSDDGRTVLAEFDAGEFVLTKTITISTDAARPWHADCTISLLNRSAEAGRTRTLEVVGPIQPRHAAADPNAAVLFAQGADVEHLDSNSIAKQLAQTPQYDRRAAAGSWSWIGARADFYLSALIPQSTLPPDAGVGLRSGMRADLHGAAAQPVGAATFRLPLPFPAAGESTSYSFTFFTGPNQHALLEDPASPYHVLEGGKIETGFLGLKLTWLADILRWLLGKLAATGMGYGLAVLALTVIVRGALFPLSRKSQISMRLHAQKMQRLKPKMDAIKEKHKDPKKQQELTMKLMREEKVSLLPGGCLLAFAQMPIWIALYSALQSAFEMRHASFLWVKDLTGPDHLLELPWLSFWPFYGWLNLLPILMMATWYTSAAMQPLPDDPQQAQTAKMMRWMPVLMGLFLYTYASGLALYMTMSALWSIGETWYIRKRWLSKLELALAK